MLVRPLNCFKTLLNDTHLEGRILSQLFLQCLPLSVQLVLASTASTVPLEQLATLAEKILKCSIPTGSTVATFSSPIPIPPLPADNSELVDLRCQVTNPSSQAHFLVAKLQTCGRSPGPFRGGPSFPDKLVPVGLPSSWFLLLVLSSLWC